MTEDPPAVSSLFTDRYELSMTLETVCECGCACYARAFHDGC
jgi:hypothetical protein